MVRTKEQKKEYDQSENGKMVNKISKWKQQGLVCDTYEDYVTIYYHWLASTHCEKCNCEYTKKNVKDMDHEHLDGKYGPYRNILCHSCNSNDDSKNTSGTPNIRWEYDRNKWVYSRNINKKQHRKRFDNKEDAIKYKVEFEKENIYINNNGAT